MAAASAGRSVMVQGRIVWTVGDLFKGRIKVDFNTKQPKRNAAGEVMMEYGFGLAVPKSVLNQVGPGQPGEIWSALHEEAFTLFPSRNIPPGFAMKYKDGDGLDDKGQPFALREGHANHIILACTTALPIKWFKFENNQNVMINEGIKCGDYVNVQLHIKAHPAQGTGKAGLYVNPNAVQFLGYGKEIVNTPSGDQIFGTGMPAIPQGASATPLVPQPGAMLMPAPAAPQNFQQPQFQQPMAPQGPPMPAASNIQPQGYPTPQPTPHFGVLPQMHQPPPGGQPMYPAAPPTAPAAMPQPMGYSTGAPSIATPAAPGYPQNTMPPYNGQQ